MAQSTSLKAPLALRLFSQIRVSDFGCWEFQGTISSEGYGIVKDDNRAYKAHRVAYEMLVTSIPESLTIDHLCRNTVCVNPLHLEPVPMGVNVTRARLTADPLTHCRNGHEYTPANTMYVTSRAKGRYRRCRTCHTAAWKGFQAIRRAKRARPATEAAVALLESYFPKS